MRFLLQTIVGSKNSLDVIQFIHVQRNHMRILGVNPHPHPAFLSFWMNKALGRQTKVTYRLRGKWFLLNKEYVKKKMMRIHFQKFSRNS